MRLVTLARQEILARLGMEALAVRVAMQAILAEQGVQVILVILVTVAVAALEETLAVAETAVRLVIQLKSRPLMATLVALMEIETLLVMVAQVAPVSCKALELEI